MGQSEVVNWVRSAAPDKLAFMRYGGEFKFAGGTKDKGETIEETARRELSEEFMTEVPSSAILHPFRVNSTRAIAGKSFLMYNFVCLADENPWLANTCSWGKGPRDVRATGLLRTHMGGKEGEDASRT